MNLRIWALLLLFLSINVLAAEEDKTVLTYLVDYEEEQE